MSRYTFLGWIAFAAYVLIGVVAVSSLMHPEARDVGQMLAIVALLMVPGGAAVGLAVGSRSGMRLEHWLAVVWTIIGPVAWYSSWGYPHSSYYGLMLSGLALPALLFAAGARWDAGVSLRRRATAAGVAVAAGALSWTLIWPLLLYGLSTPTLLTGVLAPTGFATDDSRLVAQLNLGVIAACVLLSGVPAAITRPDVAHNYRRLIGMTAFMLGLVAVSAALEMAISGSVGIWTALAGMILGTLMIGNVGVFTLCLLLQLTSRKRAAAAGDTVRGASVERG